ncbi:coiled-coil domain-containing protein [Neptunitalea lumnitzerae]|uniref:Uncharacterized protein n=1 Tax=Neptunitalea lumnitzerae TaxID=2965509 RepID=A0ABQ5MM04_9FLAO|nr:hypothetical protein [Neptunitalea sp. Y10]GLB50105.1 hypothetical protein Y10_24730 [Neptunitalea sp. Y10]
MIEQKDPSKNVKLYSQKSIALATFLGGPLAAGYLISKNYSNIEEPTHSKNALIIGILSTLILFGILLQLDDAVIDKIPSAIIPAMYTIIIYFVVEKYQGTILTLHKENGNEFYSQGKAALIGIISLLTIVTVIFGYFFLSTDEEVYNRYDAELAVFSENENETLVFYDHLDTESNATLIYELENSIIPKWKENIEIIHKTNEFKNLPSELKAQNDLLLNYAELRLEAFELFKKAIKEDSTEYSNQIEQLHYHIDVVLNKLNNL